MNKTKGGRSGGNLSSAFEAWLTEVAESENIPKDELLDRMVSSYWILQEFSEILDDADQKDAFGTADQEGQPPKHEVVESDPGETIPDENGFEGVVELIEIIREGDSPTTATSGNSTANGDSDIARIHTRIDRLTDRINRLIDESNGSHRGGERTNPSQPLPDKVVTEAELKSLSLEIEAVRNRLESETARYDEKIAELQEQAPDLQEQVNSLAGKVTGNCDQINQSVAQLSSELKAVESRHVSDFDDVNQNFSYVEEILQYVVNRGDTFEDQIERLSNQVPIAGSEHEEERLKEITQTANNQHIETAKCGDCGDTVDISLLTEPECPACSSPFEELTTETSFFGLRSANTLSTASPGVERGSKTVDGKQQSESSPPSEQASNSPAQSRDDILGTSTAGSEKVDERVADVADEFEWCSELD